MSSMATPPVQWEPPAPVVREVAPGLVYGGVLPRIVAFIVDQVILSLALLVIAVPLVGIPSPSEEAATSAAAIVYGALTLVYFVGFWTSAGRATPGMRLLRLQIGNAADGRTLTPEQGVRRWIAMGYPIDLLLVLPVLAQLASSVSTLWLIVLTVSMAVSATRQGLHDRFARSIVAQPAAGSNNALVIGCVVVIGVLIAVWFVAIVALIFLGGQLETLLSEIGTSI
jgi:uncharacterized RDD family membrane protein YckC